MSAINRFIKGTLPHFTKLEPAITKRLNQEEIFIPQTFLETLEGQGRKQKTEEKSYRFGTLSQLAGAGLCGFIGANLLITSSKKNKKNLEEVEAKDDMHIAARNLTIQLTKENRNRREIYKALEIYLLKTETALKEIQYKKLLLKNKIIQETAFNSSCEIRSIESILNDIERIGKKNEIPEITPILKQFRENAIKKKLLPPKERTYTEYSIEMAGATGAFVWNLLKGSYKYVSSTETKK